MSIKKLNCGYIVSRARMALAELLDVPVETLEMRRG
jgi:hypothetical protein